MLHSIVYINVMPIRIMDRVKKPTRETLSPKEPKKCKSHLFKEAYDQARKKKCLTKRSVSL